MRGPASVSTLLLRNVPLFSQLPEGQLALLTRVVGRKAFPRSSTIIAAGDPTDSLYIVISGRLKVMMSDDEGREVILAILGSGEFFGEMGLVDDAPRSATVIAIEPCELLTISKADFKKCLAENFDICMGVMRGLVKRLRDADRKIGSLALMDVYGRVARLPDHVDVDSRPWVQGVAVAAIEAGVARHVIDRSGLQRWLHPRHPEAISAVESDDRLFGP